MLVAISVIFATNQCYADDSEWQWVYSNSRNSYYVDTQMPEWDSETNTLTYWEKIESISGNTFYNKYKINMKAHRGYRIYVKATGNISMDRPASNHLYIHPDDIHEKEINVLCEKLHLPYLFGTTDHKWQWVTSTETANIYICTDTYIYRPDNDILIVYVKTDIPDGDNSPETSIVWYGFAIKKQYYAVNDINSLRTIVPGSIAAKVFESAKDMLHIN